MRVALIGKMRSGKSTIAELLEENLGYTRLSFGTRLKQFAHEVFDVEEGVKPRKLYQDFGQHCRQIDPDVWVKWVERDMGDNRLVVIDDLRQPNEYEWAKKNGFLLFHVKCSDEVRLMRMKNKGEDVDPKLLNHETEKHIDGYTYDYFLDGEVSPLESYQAIKWLKLFNDGMNGLVNEVEKYMNEDDE